MFSRISYAFSRLPKPTRTSEGPHNALSTAFHSRPCRSVNGANILCHTMRWTSTSAAGSPPEMENQLEKLQTLSRVRLFQSRAMKQGHELNMGRGVSVIDLSVLTKKNEHILNMSLQRGVKPKEYCVKLLAPENNATVLAAMYLENSKNLSELIFQIYSPPGNRIASMYELRGITSVGLIENSKRELQFQLLTNGGPGSCNSLKILTPGGDKVLGQMYKHKSDSFRNAFCATIHFPQSLDTNSKVSLIGASLFMMGRYH